MEKLKKDKVRGEGRMAEQGPQAGRSGCTPEWGWISFRKIGKQGARKDLCGH